MAVITLTRDNFKETVTNHEIVIVDFWAPWCEPCMEYTSTFTEVADRHPDIVFGMVNIDEHPEIGEFFEVKHIPGTLIIREQAGIHAQVGAIGAPALDEMIKWARDFDMTQVRQHYAEEDAKTATK